jgi:DNA processing protein
MKDIDLFHALALTKVDGVGAILAKKLIHHFGSAEEVFKIPKNIITKVDGVGEILYKNLKSAKPKLLASEEMRFIEKEKIQCYYFQEPQYPEKLKHCHDAPVILFGGGRLDLNASKIISVVGTRNITSYGNDFCKKFLEEIATLNPTIVSGFAYGVDIVAHTTAMDLNLQTIGVLAHGLNQIYPSAHKKYWASMEQNGGFISEFWSNTNPEKENFVRRNRIVAGISEATIVIESAEKGGSLITAYLANDYNRDVFAVPGRITDKYSQGCNNLIKTQKAHLMTSAADLIYILNWRDQLYNQEKTIQKKLFVELDPQEQLIYDYLLKNGKEHLDLIALHCDIPVYKISSILITMELKGVVRPLPGKLFEAI